MPKPKEGMTKDEYISYCISYIKKNEPSKSGWSNARLYKHCEGLWESYKNSEMSNIANKLEEAGYKPFVFNTSDFSMIEMDKGTVSMSEMSQESINDRKYIVVEAIAAVGDIFYGGEFVSKKALKSSYHMWEGTYHDISHFGTMYPSGFSYSENLDWIIGFNSDPIYDDNLNALRIKIHVNTESPKFQTWKNFVDISKDAGRVPNVSIFGFAKRKLIKASNLPAGVKIPKGAIHDGYVVVMEDIIPFAVTTCLKGKCDDSKGCGIGTGMSCDCEDNSCNIGIKDNDDDTDTKETESEEDNKQSKEEIEKIEYIKNRLKQLRS